MQNSQELIDMLNCPICLEICQDAVSTSCCTNVYCEKCIADSSSKGCPSCRQNPVSWHPEIFVRRMVGSMPAQCAKCQYATKIDQLPFHQKFCPKRGYSCNVQNCDFTSEQKEFFQHLIQNHPNQLIEKFDKQFQQSTKQESPQKQQNQTQNQKTKSKKGETGKYYCGRKQDIQCKCCDGFCGPTNGCNCQECMQLDIQELGLSKGELLNVIGNVTTRSVNNKFYCGQKLRPGTYNRLLCDGFCGPSNGPNCEWCQLLDQQAQYRYQNLL